MNLWKSLLHLFGWSVDISPLPPNKCVICVAPHTSNWDFILGYAAYRSIGRRANFLMKESWFFPPLGWLFKRMGGIPVPKVRGSSLSEEIVNKFSEAEYLNLAVTPEGTRSGNSLWRKGFLYIAINANVPIYLGIIDFKKKIVKITSHLTPSAYVVSELESIKRFYKQNACTAAKYPEKFKI